MRTLPILAAALLAACSVQTPATRGAVCPATDLSALIGRPLVEVAASAALGPVRHVPVDASRTVENPERLTLGTDGAGRIAAAWCG